ncbi:MAG: InlB B-repeat-containing protein, partial [Clostridia bacterium]|nr:InlB B-repeat-containing protein [Clostridia bacterium]
YTFLGWKLSFGAPLASGTTLTTITTPRYLNKYQSNYTISSSEINNPTSMTLNTTDRYVNFFDVKSDATIGFDYYYQDWSSNDAYVWDSANNEGYINVRGYEREFIWRYDYRDIYGSYTTDVCVDPNDTNTARYVVYAYAVFSISEDSNSQYRVKFSVPLNNEVGSVNNIGMYTSMTKGQTPFYQTTVKFNDVFDPIDVTMIGYTFKGWFITHTPLDPTETLERITVEYLDRYQVNDPNNYVFGVGSDELLEDENYRQDWSEFNSFFWRYTFRNTDSSLDADVYAYAYYTVNEESVSEYNITYYVPQDNLVGSANDISKYVSLPYASITKNFNDTIDTQVVSLIGYTFEGWFISTSKLSTGSLVLSDVRYEYLNNNYQINSTYTNDLIQSDSAIGEVRYYQDWSRGSSFVFRYTCDIYAYAVFTVNEENAPYYTIKFNVPQNNLVGSANNLSRYTTNFHTVTKNFNDTFDPIDVTLVGYTFRGWYISFVPLSSGTLGTTLIGEHTTYNGVSVHYLDDNYQVNEPNLVTTIESDSAIGNVSYNQDWSKDNVFVFRYTQDVYAYAFYTVNERDSKYNLTYYWTDDNSVYMTGAKATARGGLGIEFANDIEYYYEGQYRNSYTTSYNFNDLVTLRHDLVELDGYTFVGWYVTTSKLDKTAAAISGITREYLNKPKYNWNGTDSYQINTTYGNDLIQFDDQIGDENYYQDWANDNNQTFYFRYRADLYAYAHYVAKEYT